MKTEMILAWLTGIFLITGGALLVILVPEVQVLGYSFIGEGITIVVTALGLQLGLNWIPHAKNEIKVMELAREVKASPAKVIKPVISSAENSTVIDNLTEGLSKEDKGIFIAKFKEKIDEFKKTIEENPTEEKKDVPFFRKS